MNENNVMNSNELRIWNYVYDVNEKVSRVEQISSYNICDLTTISSKRGILHTSDIYPIPLTEEWLLKFGFVITANDETDIMMKHVNDHRMQVDIEKSGDKEVSVFFCNTWMPHIKYLHQLQNLYFALNGEELEIKL